MHKINIVDENIEDFSTADKNKKNKKIVKLNNNLFDIGLIKRLIDTDRDGFFFLDSYEKFLAFIKKRMNN
jgi:hypothetical protein